MSNRGSVVDLFCGVGGLTHGFVLEEVSVAAGVDIDDACRYPYEHNNLTPFVRHDVASLKVDDVRAWFSPNQPRILVGCAPCQPFSTYNQKSENPEWRLLSDFGRIVEELRPEIVSIENVPQLTRFRGGSVFRDFRALLDRAGYKVSAKVVPAAAYGVPQKRFRLVLLASLYGEIELESPQYDPDAYLTVRSAIAHLRPLSAGEMDESDPLHRASNLAPLNLRRIKASAPGGTWRHWNDELVASCHKAETGWGYRSVYGRMAWGEPAPTITTQYYGFGSGRFGHPEQDRAISLREGAILQSFPGDYRFVEPGNAVYFKQVGRFVGNAVPVLLSRAIARSIKVHLREHRT